MSAFEMQAAEQYRKAPAQMEAEAARRKLELAQREAATAQEVAQIDNLRRAEVRRHEGRMNDLNAAQQELGHPAQHGGDLY